MEQNTNNIGLLVMDMQAAMINNLPDVAILTANVAKAIKTAREKNILLIYVVVGFRRGAPELNINARGGVGAAGRQRWTGEFSAEFMKIHPAVTPHDSDILVTKRRVSAFSGSDLEVILRAQGIQHLVLAGYATGGVVLSTVREASDKDYRLTVLSDCCTDSDEMVHQVLVTKVFPRQTDVFSVADWITSLD